MKSKELKIYNIPRDTPSLLTMTIKPRKFLVFLMWLSVLVFCFSQTYSMIGLVATAICIFALVAMPDRKLLDIHENMIVVYDALVMDTCFCIYWEELLTWQYIKGQLTDRLRLELTDGQAIECDIYKNRKLFFYLNTFAKGKEKKGQRKRGKTL